MVKLVLPIAAALVASVATALPVPAGTWPASTGLVQLDAPQVVAAGEVFDGKMQTFELKNVQCQGQKESSKGTMVFLVEPGATLKNVIIGKNQMEGVHCEKHDCTIENVWWTDVCEDALSIKGGSATSVSKVIGGGARYADDKVVQHNGPGSVSIDGFYAEDFGKLYRSCGTCGSIKRKVAISNVYAVNPTSGIATVNKNFGDEAKFTNVHIKSAKKKVVVCGWSQGVSKGEGEPGKLGDGPSPPLCQYSESDIVLNGKAASGTGSTGADADGDANDGETPVATPAPASSSSDDNGDDNGDDDTPKTPKPSKTAKASKTPKPTKAPKTPKPSKTPKAKTPKPTEAAATDDDEYN